jgi:hypothetical protein
MLASMAVVREWLLTKWLASQQWQTLEPGARQEGSEKSTVTSRFLDIQGA